MGTPHKHAAVIKAWADGAEIQIYWDNKWVLDYAPKWYNDFEYRVKPVKKTVVVYLHKHPAYGFSFHDKPLGAVDLARGWRLLGQQTFEYEE